MTGIRKYGTSHIHTMKAGRACVLLSVILVMVPAYAAAESAPILPEIDYTINGAGATFPYPLIDLWRVEYGKQYSDIRLNYQSVGSGGGITQHIEGTVDFAASDAPMKQSELALAPGTIHIPESIGGVVAAYNIPEYPQKGLHLTGPIIADIYLGKITKWNDPRILEINEGAGLPDEDIIAVHRSDGSGTTFVFTDYLVAISPEFDKHVGKGKNVPWSGIPDGAATLVGSAGNEGVAGIVRNTPYTLGYVELAYAFQTKMSFAYIQNAHGTFIEPTLDSIRAASEGLAGNLPAAGDDWSAVTLVNAPGEDSYPISSFTYLLVYDDLTQIVDSLQKAQALIHLMHWMITDGQEYSASLLYVPISEGVADVGLRGLSQISYDGNIIWDGYGDQAPQDRPEEYVIPEWIKKNAEWWAAGQISDSDYIKALQYLVSQGILEI